MTSATVLETLTETTASSTGPPVHSDVIIVGGGIVGLVLALALKNHAQITPVIYEAAPEFVDDVGAGMGMYPNGLRVIRDIDPKLLHRLRSLGHPYVHRRWERANGSLVMDAAEEVLSGGDAELESFGIRRWRLQKALFQAVTEAGIPVLFSHKVVELRHDTDTDRTILQFKNGALASCDLLLAADGGKSAIRTLVVPDEESHLEYTGVTCLMGIAENCSTSTTTGISFPTSTQSRCHGVFFPTSHNQQCFQLHFPIPAEETNPGNWGQLSERVGQEECHKLASILERDGWDQRFLEPLRRVTKAVRIGFCLLQPPLTRWAYGPGRKIVLVGDAAHPPVPYTGQGAQQGLEDAGTLALLIRNYCSQPNCHQLDWTQWSTVVSRYEKVRIPRVTRISDMSLGFGDMQQRRATSLKYDVIQEERIQREVFFHETLPCLIPGATHNYRDHIEEACHKNPAHLPILPEENV